MGVTNNSVNQVGALINANSEIIKKFLMLFFLPEVVQILQPLHIQRKPWKIISLKQLSY